MVWGLLCVMALTPCAQPQAISLLLTRLEMRGGAGIGWLTGAKGEGVSFLLDILASSNRQSHHPVRQCTARWHHARACLTPIRV